MRFVDEAELHLIAGHGGPGAVAFRRESHMPRGGPSGGDGGDGGSVIFLAASGRPTLLDLKNQRTWRAESGDRGGGNRRSGRGGEDLVLQVPVGTLVHDAETGELLADMVEDGQRVVIARGGRGGKGNAKFATPVRRTPEYAQPGTDGEERRVRLTLKIMADVGIIGLPNAGKSTLIRSISASRAQVADYPFTTLVPNLGVVRSGILGSFVVADIPGLIEGAHTGAGLGHRFLRHVERTRLLVHVLSSSPDRSWEQDYDTIENELAQYSPELAARPQLILLSKVDLIAREDRDELIRRAKDFAESRGRRFAACSCITGEGVKAFQRMLESEVVRLTPQPPMAPHDPMA